jgi:hypothetical protein
MTRRTNSLRITLSYFGVGWVLLMPSTAVHAGGGGNVLPATAKPHGYSLPDMAEASALFATSGANPADYPDTPFQILFGEPATIQFSVVGGVLTETASNTFTVRPGTMFFMPLLDVDDAPPVIGTFPTTYAGALNYLFSPTQLGLENLEVVVDGKVTSIGSAYLVGPFAAMLGDGGSHIIRIGVFLTPLSVGTHTLSFSGELAGDLIEPVIGFAGFASAFTYTVNVVP